VNVLLVALKRLARRVRPHSGAAAPRYDRYSFPSGHALNAFAACGLLSLAEPGLAAPSLAVAANIAVARVALGRHYATDVIAGGAIGTFAAVSAHLL
jgi:undecaprenyl-diphosphatase